MRLVVVFSGQGGLRAGHLAELRRTASADTLAALRAALGERAGLLDAASAVPDDALADSAVQQPVIAALQHTRWAALAPALPRPVLLAGYSLGELSACAAAGVLPAEGLVALAGERAACMDAACAQPQAMLAVRGVREASLLPWLDARTPVAIRNGADHVVVGGTVADIDALAARLAGRPGARLTRLAVRVASHTPLLAGASARFAERLDRLPGADAGPDAGAGADAGVGVGAASPCAGPGSRGEALLAPVLAGIDASASRTVARARSALSAQISRPLDWAECLDAIVERAPDRVLEVGPGDALARMLRERDPALSVRSVDDFRDAAGALRWATGAAA